MEMEFNLAVTLAVTYIRRGFLTNLMGGANTSQRDENVYINIVSPHILPVAADAITLGLGSPSSLRIALKRGSSFRLVSVCSFCWDDFKALGDCDLLLNKTSECWMTRKLFPSVE